MKISSSSSASLLPPRPRAAGNWVFWAGFAFFFAVLGALAHHGLFIALAMDLPMLGFLLIFFRPTRKFGFGILLAALVFFATALATGGAVFE